MIKEWQNARLKTGQDIPLGPTSICYLGTHQSVIDEYNKIQEERRKVEEEFLVIQKMMIDTLHFIQNQI